MIHVGDQMGVLVAEDSDRGLAGSEGCDRRAAKRAFYFSRTNSIVSSNWLVRHLILSCEAFFVPIDSVTNLGFTHNLSERRSDIS